MQPSSLAPRPKTPARWWIVLTALAGAAGALAAIAVAGTGTYDVAPFRVEFRAWPVAAGKTEFAVEPVGGVRGGHAEAGTHNAPMAFRATITGVTLGGVDPLKALSTSDRASLSDPRTFSSFLSDNAKDAATSFGLKVGLIALGGAAAAGVAVSLVGMRWRRVFGAVLAGLVTVGVIGLMIQQTYDANEFGKTCWRQEDSPTCTQIAGG